MVSPRRGPAELGRFLRSRRSMVRPVDASWQRRRVPGLRREEVADAAGISVGYYNRLEQGRAGWVSDGVVAGLARALELDGAGSAYLAALARPARRSRPAPETLAPNVRDVVAALHLPALVLGREIDVLCWNRQGHALLAGHLPLDAPTLRSTRPNWAQLFFLDPAVRGLFTDWRSKAADTVADLRMLLGRQPGNERLQSIIANLDEASPMFHDLWSSQAVAFCHRHVRDYQHAVVGELRLSDTLFAVPEAPLQRLVIFTPDTATDAADKLARL